MAPPRRHGCGEASGPAPSVTGSTVQGALQSETHMPLRASPSALESSMHTRPPLGPWKCWMMVSPITSTPASLMYAASQSRRHELREQLEGGGGVGVGAGPPPPPTVLGSYGLSSGR